MAEALLDDPMGDPAAVIDPLGDPAAVDPMGDPASVVDPLGDPAKPAANKPGLLTQVSAGETGAIADFLQAASRPSMVEQAVFPGTGLRKLARPLLDPIANVFRGASESVEAPENLAGRLARGVGGILPAVGVSVVNPAAGVAVGALQGGGSELMAAQNAGATPLQQEVVQNLGTALGAVETFIPAGKLAKAGLLQSLAKSAGMGAGVNVGSAALQNVAAQQTYDPRRRVADGLLEAGLLGAGVPAVIHGAQAGLDRVAPAVPPPVPPPPVPQNFQGNGARAAGPETAGTGAAEIPVRPDPAPELSSAPPEPVRPGQESPVETPDAVPPPRPQSVEAAGPTTPPEAANDTRPAGAEDLRSLGPALGARVVEQAAPVEVANDAARATTTFPEFAVQEVPVRDIRLSKDVPNFKENANPETGVVDGQQLGGKYERLGTAPIVVWERLDGAKEVITGRHRFDLARRSGERTIPAQIVREADGFDKLRAFTLDAEANIRDGNGEVKDYAHYFRNRPDITRAEAEARGLLSRTKGGSGWALGKDASDDLYSAFVNGKIEQGKAVAIAQGAPGDAAIQAAAVKSAGAKSAAELKQFARALTLMPRAAKSEQTDLFGFDDSAIRESEALAKAASGKIAELKQTESILAAAINKGEALKLRPEKAKELGLSRKPSPEALQDARNQIARELIRYDQWSTDPATMNELRAAAGLKPAEPPKLALTLTAEPPPSKVETAAEKTPEQIAAEQRAAGTGDMFGAPPKPETLTLQSSPESGWSVVDGWDIEGHPTYSRRSTTDGQITLKWSPMVGAYVATKGSGQLIRSYESLGEAYESLSKMFRWEIPSKKPWQMTKTEYDALLGGRADKMTGEPFMPDAFELRAGETMDQQLGRWMNLVDENTRLLRARFPTSKAMLDHEGGIHKAVIQQALKEGLAVPKEVLSAYPDLQTALSGAETLTLQSETRDQRAAREKAAADKTEIARRQNERKTGNAGDLGTGDMFDKTAGENALFTQQNARPETGTQRLVDLQQVEAAKPSKAVGAAHPSDEGFIDGTALKNAVAEMERLQHGATEAVETVSRPMARAWMQAGEALAADPQAGYRLVDELQRDPGRGMTDVESAVLLRHKAAVINAKNEAASRTHSADAEERRAALAMHALYSDQLLDILDAAKARGSEWGREGRWRQIVAREDFSLANMETERRAANGGERLTDRQQAETEKFQKRIEEADRKIAEHDDRKQTAGARHTLENMKREVRRGDGATLDDIRARMQELGPDLFRDEPQAGGVPSSLLAELAKAHIRAGVKELDPLVAALQTDLKPYFGDLDAKTIRDALSGYGKVRYPSKDEVLRKLRELQVQARLVSGIEDASAGRAPLRTGQQRDRPTEAVRLLQNELRRLIRENPDLQQISAEQQMATALQSLKTRLKNQTLDYQRRLREGDFAKQPPKYLDLDREAIDLQFQREQAKVAWNDALIKDKLARRNAVEKVVGTVQEAVNSSRSIVTSFDLSAVLRQGGFMALSHPIRSARALPDMFRSLQSGKAAYAIERELQNRPNAGLYKRAKLFIATRNTNLNRMEEEYMSRWARKIPGVGASERAYTTFLNRLRADAFDAMVDGFVAKRGKPTDAELRAISNFVNIATGRGHFGATDHVAAGLNTVLFSPRFVASRFQLLAGQPLWKGSAATRKAIAAEYARFLTGVAAVYLLASAMTDEPVETDPRSSSFGKIKFGNTTLDPMGGLLQTAVFATRMAMGETKTQKGAVERIRGADFKFGQDDSFDVMARFFRTKLNPVVGASVNTLTGADIMGRPTTALQQAARLAAPISVGDIYSVLQDRGVAAGTALGLLALFGMGVQVREEQPRKARIISEE